MTDSIDALWNRYRRTGHSRERTQLLDRYIGLVHHGAHRLARRIPREVEIDELIGAGTLGLVQALEGYDPGCGIAFGAFATPRIRSAMLDELRKREATPPSAGRVDGAPDGDPGDVPGGNEAPAGLGEAFDHLAERDRLVLSLGYLEGLDPHQIGEVLHVSGSRVSQIRARALRRLRERVAGAEGEAA